mgnify:CR=1 FL=1
MSTQARIILSWVAVAAAFALSVLDLFSPRMFGDPSIIAPLTAAYVLRYELRPIIPREQAPPRLWLLVPVGAFVLYLLLPINALLGVTISTAAIWSVRDDMSIHRHRSHEHTPA